MGISRGIRIWDICKSNGLSKGGLGHSDIQSSCAVSIVEPERFFVGRARHGGFRTQRSRSDATKCHGASWLSGSARRVAPGSAHVAGGGRRVAGGGGEGRVTGVDNGRTRSLCADGKLHLQEQKPSWRTRRNSKRYQIVAV